mmetsp:Transcript_37203/g.118389  ORF Transcript_37203/g.118389 Transcript_37203/m.118389 type:complete len:276 (+) Transcript_37203:70-897(+)
MSRFQAQAMSHACALLPSPLSSARPRCVRNRGSHDQLVCRGRQPRPHDAPVGPEHVHELPGRRPPSSPQGVALVQRRPPQLRVAALQAPEQLRQARGKVHRLRRVRPDVEEAAALQGLVAAAVDRGHSVAVGRRAVGELRALPIGEALGPEQELEVTHDEGTVIEHRVVDREGNLLPRGRGHLAGQHGPHVQAVHARQREARAVAEHALGVRVRGVHAREVAEGGVPVRDVQVLPELRAAHAPRQEAPGGEGPPRTAAATCSGCPRPAARSACRR